MSENKIEKNYKGFELISETEIPDCSSTGIYLRHKKTGLEVFHLLNDDEENLFAFAFRTPVKDSTGAAHIMEHSVFCGSEKFPLKEPFTNMMNQSVNTFLNALTYSDKTVYPASSTVKSDYFNLMDVYGDAVFFPLLKKEAFLQEAHRIELDENGKPSVQGVVYNEMKGSYSSFESVANDAQLRSLFPDTNYAFDSGGDPMDIPGFSYEAFRDFHKKYYRPDNCLVFLYGNISTKEQLDFLQEHFLNRLEEKFPEAHESEYYPCVPKEFEDIETPEPQFAPIKIVEKAPASGATGSTVTVNWLCGLTKNITSYIEASFMSEVLAGHDGSPLAKVLVESELGDDLAPVCGVSNETRNFMISFGLHGVKRCNEKKVYRLIFDTLKKICKNGINRNDVDSALMSAEFANREVVRVSGPYSLVLLDRALNGWNYGRNPAEMLLYRAEFEKIRKNLENDSAYVENLIRRFMLENDRVSFVAVRPSKSYLLKREKKERKLLNKLLEKEDLSQIKKDLELLHAYQNHRETEDEVSCIPHLNLSELSTDFERIETKIVKVESSGAEIPVFANKEGTNGIGYFEVLFPLDSLTPEEYFYLPFFSYCASNIGWNGKDWVQCAEETALQTGGIYTRLLTSAASKTEKANEMAEKLKELNVVNRDWIVFSVRYLDEKLDDALDLFAECLSGYEFSDLKRLKNLLGETLGSLKASVVPQGNRYAARRARCLKNHTTSVEEMWFGISQLFFLNKISKKSPEEISEKFASIKQKLLKAGAVLHLVADENTLNISMKKMPEFIKNAKITPVEAKKNQDDKEFEKLLALPGEKSGIPDTEVFSVDSQVGFAASALSGTYFGEKENAADFVLAHWLSGTFLWEQIRTTGGAYGAYASCLNLSGLFNLSTFRDPSPEKSVQTFKKCLEDAAGADFSEKECERAVTGTYGDEIQPHSPYGRGTAGFYRTIYCISEDDRHEKLVNLLAVKPEDVKKAAENLLKGINSSRTVVIENKTEKNAGVNVKLPL